eukprot:12420470-Karenia_brevis.AAC.1
MSFQRKKAFKSDSEESKPVKDKKKKKGDAEKEATHDMESEPGPKEDEDQEDSFRYDPSRLEFVEQLTCHRVCD